MITMGQVEEQLKRIGCNFRFWGRPELKELCNVLLPEESIEHCINGQYEGGFALLCATDQRVLLIDKKPIYLTIEDVRYDMIAELDYNYRLIISTLKIFTPNKSLYFTGYNQHRMRSIYSYIQQRVMDIRQHYIQQALAQQSAEMLPQAQTGQGSLSVPGGGVKNGSAAVPATVSSQAVTGLKSVSPQQIGVAGVRRVVPIIGAYMRLPLRSRQQRYRGSHQLGAGRK